MKTIEVKDVTQADKIGVKHGSRTCSTCCWFDKFEHCEHYDEPTKAHLKSCAEYL